MLEQAFAGYKAHYGKSQFNTLLVMRGLAKAYRGNAQTDKAIAKFKEAVELSTDAMGKDHSWTLKTMNDLAITYWSAGQSGDAISVFQARAQRKYDTSSMNDLRILQDMTDLSFSWYEDEKYENAERLCRETWKIRKNSYPDDWRTFYEQCCLGVALTALKRDEEAEQMLRLGCEGMLERSNNIPQESRDRLSLAVGWLIKLYEKLDKPDEAAKWRAELKKDGVGEEPRE